MLCDRATEGFRSEAWIHSVTAKRLFLVFDGLRSEIAISVIIENEYQSLHNCIPDFLSSFQLSGAGAHFILNS